MSKSCREIELLPWLVNGSLEESERNPLVAHLQACASCRRELEETIEAAQILGRHLPSLTLAEYAQGLAPSEVDRELVESHLAVCPSCRREVERAMPDPVVDFETARAARRRRPRRSGGAGLPRRPAAWRRVALAAGLAATVVSGALFWSWRRVEPAAPAAGGERQAEVAQTVIFSDDFEMGGAVSWKVPESLSTESHGSEELRN